MKAPRVLIAAPRSGSGKTVITISLIKSLLDLGKKVSAFKCGPDFIDPQFHSIILGVDSKNLDMFFSDTETVKGLFLQHNESDVSVIEGVMGLYDGIGGTTSKASTYELATALDCPIILVVDVRGMSFSVLAEISGYLSMDHKKLIKGVILNNMNQMLFPKIKEEIETRFSLTVLGYFPKMEECDVGSRYLGLVLPDEITDIKERIERAAEEFVKTVDVSKVIDMANDSAELFSSFSYPERKTPVTRIAVAMDEAFNFYYKDNLALLENLGAQLVYFSPLKDSKLPENIGGLILGGGYPELFAEELEKNISMKKSIAEHVRNGIPLWAECGGFIYLHCSLEDNGRSFSLCGVINGTCVKKDRLVRFGYLTLNEYDVKGHEFHYFDSDCNGDLCTAEKPVSGRNWKCGHDINGGFQGFPHLYYASNIKYAEEIVEKCRKYKGI